MILFNMSILPLIASFTSALSCCITSATSCLNCCCNVAKSAGVTMSARCSAVAAATAAAAAGAVLGLGVARAFPLVASLRDHVKCNPILWHDLSQRECVGKMVKCTRQVWKQGKQMCKSATVSSLRVIQHSLSAWAIFAPKLTATLTVAGKNPAFRYFIMRSPISWSASVSLNDMTPLHDAL